MMIRSMPPASAHLADRPMPAPPPTIGRPAATWARSRRRHSSRVNMRCLRSYLVPCTSYSLHGVTPMAVLLIGTLDTKGVEFQFVRDLLQEAGVATLVADAGVMAPPLFAPDVARERLFAAV